MKTLTSRERGWTSIGTGSHVKADRGRSAGAMGVGRGSRPPVMWSNLRCHVRFCAGQGQVRHSAQLEPLGTRSGVGQAGAVEENRTGGASMWTSPSGLGAS